MGGCSSPNCTNRHSKGFSLYRFPRDKDKRAIWLQNCRREGWEPTDASRLCEVHFEESQFESKRADNLKKLKPNAVPTLFDLPNSPLNQSIQQQHNSDIFNSGEPHITETNEIVPSCIHLDSTAALQKKIIQQELEIAKLKLDLKSAAMQLEKLKKFLSPEQLESLKHESAGHKWSNEAIISALKLRYALGVNGYEHLKKTNYPTPSYSTLNRRIQHIQIEFGIFSDLIELLKTKISVMDTNDKYCVLLLDEMQISGNTAFEKTEQSFLGQVTLGDKTKNGNHLTTVMVCGICKPWKQLVASHITGPSTLGSDSASFIKEVINIVENIGLNVKAVITDMGSNNKSMWKNLGVIVNKKDRITSFKINNKYVHVFADPAHLLKNTKNALSKHTFQLPNYIKQREDLPTTEVHGKYIEDLWMKESEGNCLKTLHHLKKEDIEPTQFQKMNVGSAMCYFSIKTAAALEFAVISKILPPEALSTAWFVRLVHQWFQLCSARTAQLSITSKNKESKFRFLNEYVNIISNVKIDGCWKPVNTGLILSSISLMNVSKECFEEGIQFIMGSRFSQDALENVFSQIRRKSSLLPSALECKRALKLISVSQVISDIRGKNYSNDNDHYLLDILCETKVNLDNSNIQTENNSHYEGNETAIAVNNLLKETSCTTSKENQLNIIDQNNLYYISGSIIKSLMKKNICEKCQMILYQENNENSCIQTTEKRHKVLVDCSNMGGLTYASDFVFQIVVRCECLFKSEEEKYKINGKVDKNFAKRILAETVSSTQSCCKIEEKIINSFITIRGYAVENHENALNLSILMNLVELLKS